MPDGTRDGAGSESPGERVGPGVTAPPGAVRTAFVASSGPGGQNVNKRATKCQLRVEVAALGLAARVRARLVRLAGDLMTDAGELLIQSDEHRSQKRNEAACRERLWDLLARALTEPKPRKKTRPTKGSVERRLQAKREASERKKRRRFDE
ncbi:MAG: alternative ribosome rescue aminoacyl-tRNA hydrolase ArfB [Phycisphaerales bacterium]|jgi:ribosome-associated protein|nr:alternative ribosome rescue aminoacyl-tRNA hydrolase ArfB [Phycisphaerales bacterium]